MAQRFYSRLDLDTFDKFNKELVGDAKEDKDGIIFQQVDVYKISVSDTKTNIYGETVGGKVFRDGPTKVGRGREFTQCDADIIGIKGVLAEAETLKMFYETYKLYCKNKYSYYE